MRISREVRIVESLAKSALQIVRSLNQEQFENNIFGHENIMITGHQDVGLSENKNRFSTGWKMIVKINEE